MGNVLRSAVACLGAALVSACAAAPLSPAIFGSVDAEAPGTASSPPEAGATPSDIVLSAASPSSLARDGSGATADRRAALGAFRADEAGAEKGWEFGLVPYLWLMNMDGHVTVKGNRAKVNESFSDIWDNLEFAAEGVFAARHGSTTYMLDASYLQLEANATVGGVGVDVTLDTWLVQGTVAEDVDDDRSLQVYGAARYWNMSADVDLSIGPTFSGSEYWFDPVVGVTKAWPLGDEGHWSMITTGDIGGGGFGNWGSDFAYKAELLFRRAFTDGNMFIGYRYLYSDYETGSGTNEFKSDLAVYGPLIGWGFIF